VVLVVLVRLEVVGVGSQYQSDSREWDREQEQSLVSRLQQSKLPGEQLKLSDVAVIVIATVIAPWAVICVSAVMDLGLYLDLVVGLLALARAGLQHRMHFHGTPIPSQTEMIPPDVRPS
jgi:hypothetical protein